MTSLNWLQFILLKAMYPKINLMTIKYIFGCIRQSITVSHKKSNQFKKEKTISVPVNHFLNEPHTRNKTQNISK